MKLKEIFLPIIQGHQITDEEIYQSVIKNGRIPILTANNEIKGYWEKAIVSESDLPCISYPTKANSGVCFVQTSIFDANNTAVLIPKPELRSNLCLEWLAFKLSKFFPKIATSKEGVNYLNKEIVEEVELDLPNYDTQLAQYNSIRKLLQTKARIEQILEKITYLKNSMLVINYRQFQAKNILVGILFDCLSGNSGLTEEYLYQNTFFDENKKYKVLTGSTSIDNRSFTSLCWMPKNQGKHIRVHSGEGIHVTRKGQAGVINYLPNGFYTLNDDAYILFKSRWNTYDLSLKWVTIAYRSLFGEYASNSDNATWNKGSFIKHAVMDIPERKEQDLIVGKYILLEKLEQTIRAIAEKVDSALNQEIIANQI